MPLALGQVKNQNHAIINQKTIHQHASGIYRKQSSLCEKREIPTEPCSLALGFCCCTKTNVTLTLPSYLQIGPG